MGTLAMAEQKQQLDERWIQKKAYELWQSRGCPAGNPEQDWFDAIGLLTQAANTAPDSPTGAGAPRSVAERQPASHAPSVTAPASPSPATGPEKSPDPAVAAPRKAEPASNTPARASEPPREPAAVQSVPPSKPAPAVAQAREPVPQNGARAAGKSAKSSNGRKAAKS